MLQPDLCIPRFIHCVALQIYTRRAVLRPVLFGGGALSSLFPKMEWHGAGGREGGPRATIATPCFPVVSGMIQPVPLGPPDAAWPLKFLRCGLRGPQLPCHEGCWDWGGRWSWVCSSSSAQSGADDAERGGCPKSVEIQPFPFSLSAASEAGRGRMFLLLLLIL